MILVGHSRVICLLPGPWHGATAILKRIDYESNLLIIEVEGFEIDVLPSEIKEATRFWDRVYNYIFS